ncbi:MAG: hypothetical protein JXR81_01700, partial [Candidatus Goldbacteria bacterium]|nr:hypothetical protein [Candidatus Goldiibacteriota bacterium]
MKRISAAVFACVFLFIFNITIFASQEVLSSKTNKTDFKATAKIIGVADANKQYSYVDMGKAQGVKVGDKFYVEGKYGKVQVEVVQSFDRMSAVKVVDSYLLGEGQEGQIIPQSRYAKAEIKQYRVKPYTVVKKKPAAKKKVAKKKAAPKKAPVVAEPVIEAPLAPESGSEFPGMDIMAEPGMEAEPGMDMMAEPGMEAEPGMDMMEEPGMDMGMDMMAEPGLEGMPGDDLGMDSEMGMGDESVGLPGEDMPADDMGMDDMGMGDDMGMPADDMGMDDM